MKKLLFSVALSILALSASAQISKGNIMVGGDIVDLDFQFDKQTTLGITPKAAWFIKDGLAVGAYANFGFTHQKGADGSVYTYGVGPMARYYIPYNDLHVLKQTRFFLEANVGFEGQDNTVSDKNTNGLGFGVGPGLAYFVTPNIGLEALVKYQGLVGFGSETYQNGLNISVGLQIYLPSKRMANIVNQ
ncbi:MAG: porin family protein [Candidatus Azobacteroides sp.]|nr:porin family protein [Candidatus Azobacteroides sp.]